MDTRVDGIQLHKRYYVLTSLLKHLVSRDLIDKASKNIRFPGIEILAVARVIIFGVFKSSPGSGFVVW